MSAHRHETDPHAEWNYQVRGETPHQRLDRNYAELLQEVRVAQTGTQLLLAFLLTLAFTPRFATITEFQRVIYVVCLVLGASSTALMIAPAAFHRMVFQRRLKHTLMRVSCRFAHFGLILMMLAMCGSLLLILDVVVGSPFAIWITAGVGAWFSLWWYALPLFNRVAQSRTSEDQPVPLIVVPGGDRDAH